jgi:hypothetical protein
MTSEQEIQPPNKSIDALPFDDHPELIFGLVGPIGVDLESVTEALTAALADFDYDTQVFRITDLMREVKVGLPLDATGYVESFQQRIAYPKSYAEELHSDSIEVDGDGSGTRVNFERFLGISPYRYRELFEKGKRKYSTGAAQRWNRDVKKPMIDVIFPSYFKAEAHVVGLLDERLKAINARSP